MSRKTASLTTKLILWKLTTIMAILSVFVYFYTNVTADSMRQSEQQKVEMLSKMLGNLIHGALDLGLMDSVLDTVRFTHASNPNLIKTVITTPESGVLLSYPENARPPANAFSASHTIQIQSLQHRHIIGTITLYYSDRDFQALLQDHTRIFLLMLLLLLGSLIISFVVTRYLLSPLSELTQKILDFDPEKPKVSFTSTQRQDEIGLIESAFHKMLLRFTLYHERIETLNETLEQKVEDRTEELQKAKSTLEEKNREITYALQHLKDTQKQLVETEKMASLGNLVAGIAHEINTPIGVAVTASTSLMSRADKMKKQIKNGNIEAACPLFVKSVMEGNEIIYNNLRRSADLIRSFKHVAVGRTNDTIQKFDLQEYLHDIRTSLTPQLKKKQHAIEIRCPAGIEVESYPGALSQVITNLVENSISHGFGTREHGHITITLGDYDGSWLALEYADNGNGMPDEVLAKIYEPFYTTARGQGGSGLGMNIVYNLIHQKLMGTIDGFSQLGEGVRFKIRIRRRLATLI